ncbi:hypothetical protein EDD86DRAFT_245140 [Gorgonomyces haynaldii]|nr:hypothetical protein EDD86DRAFT_245140 [Gorgonomyces haynaldii]
MSLNCASCGLSGPFPDISGLTALEILSLGNNQFTSLGNFASKSLRYLYSSDNKLSGSLSDFSNAPALESIDLQNNQLTGDVKNLQTLKKLRSVYLSGNTGLSGNLPTLSSNVYSCNLKKTNICKPAGDASICEAEPCLVGELKTQCTAILKAFSEMGGGDVPLDGNCCLFKGVECSENGVTEVNWESSALSGPISKNLFVSTIKKLDLSNNKLTVIPPEIKNLQKLERLDLSGNLLKDIPVEVSQLPNLASFYFYSQDFKVSFNNPSSTPGYKALTSCIDADKICVTKGSIYPSPCGIADECPAGGVIYDCGIAQTISRQISGPSVYENCCDSSGISCDAEGFITGIDWSGQYLTGSFPEQLASLKRLKSLNFSTNSFSYHLTGEVPASISKITELETLSLNNQRFNGSLDWIGSLPKLKVLDLADNTFTSTLPSSIGNLNSVTGLTGTIPQEMQQLTKLTSLILKKGQLTGPVPSWLGSFKSLSVLDLSSQNFTSLETDFSGVPLTTLKLEQNKNLIGKLSKLQSLQVCAVSGTKICKDSQHIPPAICDIKNQCQTDANTKDCATYRSIYEQMTTNKDPTTYPDPKKCCTEYGTTCNDNGITEIRAGSFKGPWPDAIGSLSELRSLSVGMDTVDVQFPDSFSNLQKLETLDISRSNYLARNLTVTFPTVLTYLSNLKKLSLVGAGITGSIPSDIQYLSGLEVLNLSNNDLQGPLTPEIGYLSQLKQLYLSRNRLKGDLPQEWSNLKQLQTLDLTYNQLFTGPFPNPPSNAGFQNLTVCSLDRSEICFDKDHIAPPACKIAFQCVDDSIRQQCKTLAEAWTDMGGSDIYRPGEGNCCQYDGVTCVNNQITEIVFNFRPGYFENLSQNLTVLPSLKRLELGGAYDFKLETFSLNDGILESGLDTIAQVSTLKSLSLSSNRINGTIPDSLAALDLTLLDLSNNLLTGSIPSGFKDMKNLQKLNLAENKLSGAFVNPKSAPGYPSLKSCTLSGTVCQDQDNLVPSACYWNFQCQADENKKQCQAARDLYLALGGSESGAPPVENCCFNSNIQCIGQDVTSVSYSFLQGGNITASGPFFAALSQLQSLTLYSCSLTSAFPPEFYQLKSLKDVDLDSNKLREIPEAFGTLNLTSLSVANNQLTTVPSFLYKMQYLNTLYLSGNRGLVGSIPNPVASPGFPSLRYCSVYNTLLCSDPLNVVPTACSVQTKCPSQQIQDQCALLQSAFADMQAPSAFDSKFCCGNQGVKCEGDNIVSVSSIDQVSGPLSKKLFGLTFLKSLEIASDYLSGELPSGFSNLTKLQSLTVRARSLDPFDPQSTLTGSLPSDLASLNLTSLSLAGQKLGGSLQVIAALKNLVTVDLSETRFSSSNELRNHPSIQSFTADHAEFTGNALDAFGTIQTLQILKLTDNKLYGNIPPTLGRLPNLTDLDLDHNYELSGAFPSFKSNPTFTALKSCDLYGTAVCSDDLRAIPRVCFTESGITCPVPKIQAQCDKVRQMRRSLNIPVETSGRISSNGCCIGDYMGTTCSKDEVVSIAFEDANGPFPQNLASDFPGLKSIYFESVTMNSTIPESISNLANLESLTLKRCALNGSIPSSLGRLSNLKRLDLSINTLSGEIPSALGDLKKLESLSIYYNQLTGQIPSSLYTLPTLYNFVIGENQFSGPIPDAIGNLTALKYWSAGRNKFTGSIPESIGNLVNLTQIVLSNNQLTGPLPSSLSKLTNLTYLSLNGNSFNGTFPANATALKLTQCDVYSSGICQTADNPAPSACRDVPKCKI